MKKLIFLIAILGLCYANISQAAQTPRGNYQQTCRQCEMNHGNLYCICQTERGYWQRTNLSLARKCIKATNSNGNLQCTKWAHHSRQRPEPGYAPRRKQHHGGRNHWNNLPAGNYRQSCNSCSYNNGVLNCSCKRNNGRRVNSTFRGNCPGSISNQNGALICRG